MDIDWRKLLPYLLTYGLVLSGFFEWFVNLFTLSIQNDFSTFSDILQVSAYYLTSELGLTIAFFLAVFALGNMFFDSKAARAFIPAIVSVVYLFAIFRFTNPWGWGNWGELAFGMVSLFNLVFIFLMTFSLMLAEEKDNLLLVSKVLFSVMIVLWCLNFGVILFV